MLYAREVDLAASTGNPPKSKTLDAHLLLLLVFDLLLGLFRRLSILQFLRQHAMSAWTIVVTPSSASYWSLAVTVKLWTAQSLCKLLMLLSPSFQYRVENLMHGLAHLVRYCENILLMCLVEMFQPVDLMGLSPDILDLKFGSSFGRDFEALKPAEKVFFGVSTTSMKSAGEEQFDLEPWLSLRLAESSFRPEKVDVVLWQSVQEGDDLCKIEVDYPSCDRIHCLAKQVGVDLLAHKA